MNLTRKHFRPGVRATSVKIAWLLFSLITTIIEGTQEVFQIQSQAQDAISAQYKQPSWGNTLSKSNAWKSCDVLSFRGKCLYPLSVLWPQRRLPECGVPSQLSRVTRSDGWYEWVTCSATPSVSAGEAASDRKLSFQCNYETRGVSCLTHLKSTSGSTVITRRYTCDGKGIKLLAQRWMT